MPSTSVGLAARIRIGCLIGACCWLASMQARADLIYELAPSAGVGATDNARVTSEGAAHASDGFSIVGASARVHYNGARMTHGLGYRITHTRYFEEQGTSTLANVLMWNSSFSLSPRVTLGLGASGLLARTSGLDPTNPATAFQEAAIPGSTRYVTASGIQSLVYQPTPQRTYSETLSVTQLRYLDSMMNGVAVEMPMTTFTSLALRGERSVGRDGFTLAVTLADNYVVAPPGSTRGAFAFGHIFMGRALAGWRRELSPTWTTSVEAGPAVLVKLDGSGVLAPAFIAMLNYTHLYWYASLTLSQTPAPNLFLGAATLSDQLMARVAVPLTRNERLYVGGYGGYLYARISDGNQTVTRAYDQVMGAVSVNWRFSSAPLAAALVYTALSQRGSSLPDYSIPDLARQSVLFIIRSEIAWGPGTPPLFGGPL